MDKDYEHIDFIIFCIEIYKENKGLNGKEAYNLLVSSGAIDYIDECYEALHTFGEDNIIWNIDEFIKNK